MKFVLLGTGYVGKALLTESPGLCTFSASTTAQEKVPSLLPFAQEVFVLKSHEAEKIKKIINTSDGIAIFIAPKQDQNYEIYLETAKTLSILLQDRKKPFYLIYTGSTFVYEGSNGRGEESALLTPSHPKAQILLETEQTYLSCASEHVRICILRLGGIYGPGRELIDRSKQLSNRLLPGTGNELTNHIHIDDVVSAVEFCIKNQVESIYNLVNEDHPSRKNLYDSLCHFLNIPPPLWDKQSIPTHGCGYAVSSKKIKDLGFIFTHDHLSWKKPS